MKIRTESIIDPNSEILALQEETLKEISDQLPDSEVELIGAMAVPMAGRPELDILVISEHPAADSEILVKGGYKQGPVVYGQSFLKKKVGDIEIAIQVMAPDNKIIRIHRGVIKKLREDVELRKRYEDFKQTLSGLTREEYKERKTTWLKENILPLISLA